jgi:hypothetical protein
MEQSLLLAVRFPCSLITVALHTRLPLHAAVTRETKGQSLEIIKYNNISEIWEYLREELILFFFEIVHNVCVYFHIYCQGQVVNSTVLFLLMEVNTNVEVIFVPFPTLFVYKKRDSKW